MQTVNFNCEQCGQLMAVGAEHLGQQVRCPHCQQVVMAPAAPAEQPTVDLPNPTPPAVEAESIFTAPEPEGDDLFGGGPAPVVDMPSAPWLMNEPKEIERPEVSEPAPLVDVEPVPEVAVTAAAPVAAPQPAPSDGDAATTEARTLVDELPTVLSSRPDRTVTGRPNLGLIVVLIFLVPYSLCATAAALYFYFQRINTPHPLEAIPDFFGDHPGVTQKQGHVSIIWERPKPDMDLPARDHVALHQALTIGDLEVVPEKIERGRVTIYRPLLKGRETDALNVGLLLTLRVRNVSRGDSFFPADGFFYRRWQKDDPPGNKPYTFLQANGKRFYGGPVKWVPPGQDEARYFVEGEENFNQVLRPGDSRRLLICTDPENQAVLQAVAAATDTLHWRVQLRRGPIHYKDHDIPVSAVVAVDFSAQEIQ
jgi:hypothetical protein